MKTVFITGAASGFGHATAEFFGAQAMMHKPLLIPHGFQRPRGDFGDEAQNVRATALRKRKLRARI